jgi:SAM-dependent methyltransferase
VRYALHSLALAHSRLVHGRRVRAVASALARLIEPGWNVLDVGCGDGRISRQVQEAVAGVTLQGYDVLARRDAAVPVQVFDGTHLPVEDKAVDLVMLVDVLHHSADPFGLLWEAKRVARRAILVKDHRLARRLARPTLAFMDWIGNRAHGVALPYSYWGEPRWQDAWMRLGLTVDHYQTRIGMYPWPASLLFERGLHFIARLGIRP